MASPVSVAVLDDYPDFSKSFFATLDPASYKVTVFRDTLRPYNHPETTDAERDALVKRLEPFEILCIMRERTPFPEALVNRLPNLKLLLSTSVRNNSLDLPAFKARGIPVAGTVEKNRNQTAPNPAPDSTTTHCVSLILALVRDIPNSHNAVQNGLWQVSMATSLPGKTFAVLGLGRLGLNVARIMSTLFGMRIIAWSENLTQESADERVKAIGLPVDSPYFSGEKTVTVVSKEDLFREADVLSVHLVLSDRSRGIVAAEDLGRMKPTAFIVNTSRGPLIKERDLLDTLKQGTIAGAAIDVFDLEPLPKDSEWRTVKWGADGTSRVVLTPHMGYMAKETMSSWYEQQVENIKRWAAGEELQTRLV
ncbi:hypothetical protein jhhlp_005269 [Lomentospora prolificans]|uniref:D-isomer specific 2-hydroxyacid dehydrogenase NAD-binding domain-containing protein n=1 Tax=Lomentospora prolificans TaxID=41688 RepID=A0A2N3N7A5_9PEZI|nr:hypothetical protein jhhlp_005269 [Lomentospora prolificans]